MAELTADDVKALVAAEVAKLTATTTASPRRRFFEATFSGPARGRKRAVEALTDAGYDVREHDPIHADNSDGWLTVEVDWTGEEPIEGDFQSHHLARLQGLLQPYSYELRGSGVSAGRVTR